MMALLVKHTRIIDELGNTIEAKIWQLQKPSKDKPHGYKYSLVYIVSGVRVIGYDNAEGKGDHRHYKDRETTYVFSNLENLLSDFFGDIGKLTGGYYENQEG